jgi:Sortilin, neurotensin receptor 3,
MTASSKRILYIGTAEGLYEAESDNGAYRTRSLGLHYSGPIRSPVVIDWRDPTRIYAATSRGGVFRSDDRGTTWQEINQGIVYKEAWSLVQHPRTGELVLGTGPSSVFKSNDGGDSWIDCEQIRTLPETKDWTFPQPPHVSHVKGLALRADDPLLIFGAIEEGWIVRSKDGGKTWQNIQEGTEFDSHSVAVMPDDATVVIATSGKSFYKSTDGGDHFARCDQGLDRQYMTQAALHSSRAHMFLTAAAAVPPPFWRRPEGADTAFYRSEDRGDSWKRLSGGLPGYLKIAPRAVAGDPEDPSSFLFGMADGSVWITEDSGEYFRQIVAGLPQVMSICVAHR